MTAARTQAPARRATYAALAGSWVGDIALMRPGARAFVPGAGAFALGQTGWLSALAPRVSPGGWRTTSAKVLATGWALGAPGVAVKASMEHPPLGPVLAGYSGALTAVSAAALNLGPRQPAYARRTASAGALLFLLSDSLIGLSQFVLETTDPRWDAAVMATYTAAQGLLEEGVAHLR